MSMRLLRKESELEMSKKGRVSPQPKFPKKPLSEKLSMEPSTRARTEAPTLIEKKKRASAAEEGSLPDYENRLSGIEDSIREIQASVFLLKKAQEDAALEREKPLVVEERKPPKETQKLIDQVPVINTLQLEELKKQEEGLKARVESLKTELSETQKKIDALHEHYISQNQALDREFKARQLTIHQRADEERTKSDAEIEFLTKQRNSLQEEIRVLVSEKQALSKEVALGRSLSMILKNPDAMSAADINLLIEKFVEARDTRASGAKYLSNINTREARRSLISSIMKIGKQAGHA